MNRAEELAIEQCHKELMGILHIACEVLQVAGYQILVENISSKTQQLKAVMSELTKKE